MDELLFDCSEDVPDHDCAKWRGSLSAGRLVLHLVVRGWNLERKDANKASLEFRGEGGL
jgi:hypothetical protein